METLGSASEMRRRRLTINHSLSTVSPNRVRPYK